MHVATQLNTEESLVLLSPAALNQQHLRGINHATWVRACTVLNCNRLHRSRGRSWAVSASLIEYELIVLPTSRYCLPASTTKFGRDHGEWNGEACWMSGRSFRLLSGIWPAQGEAQGATGVRTERKQHEEHNHNAADHEVVRYQRRFMLDATGGMDRRVRIFGDSKCWHDRPSQAVINRRHRRPPTDLGRGTRRGPGVCTLCAESSASSHTHTGTLPRMIFVWPSAYFSIWKIKTLALIITGFVMFPHTL